MLHQDFALAHDADGAAVVDNEDVALAVLLHGGEGGADGGALVMETGG